MEAKWYRQVLNQLSGARLVVDNLLLNQYEIFEPQEIEILKKAAIILNEKGKSLRNNSPGGG
ncbi:MAG: hypothetical protein ACM3O9_06360 [Methylocystaceae bacterium]